MIFYFLHWWEEYFLREIRKDIYKALTDTFIERIKDDFADLIFNFRSNKLRFEF